ncbi:MAG: SusC/RagA family protein [Deltaproteobacteria bacterium]|nr:MAG: SusC/RagA family protein [Deltaproteobacteria bacterium]
MKKNESGIGMILKRYYSSKFNKIMRLSLLFFFVGVFNLIASNSYSQNTRISLDINQTAISEVLSEIELQSEFYFLYNNKLVDVSRKVDIHVENKKIKNILNDLLAETDVSYVVMDRQIVLSPKYMITKAIGKKQVLQQNQITITGKVTDETGSSIPGVNIAIKGTSIGTITNVDGNYNLQIDEPGAVLVFSFVGYTSQEITVGNQTTINVTLVETAVSIDEVVTIGYGTMKKLDLTGAVSNIKMDEVLGNRPVNTIAEAIQGASPGLVIINSSGQPDEQFSYNIRGATSINGGQPLFLVDNIPMDINLLNPSDIESVTVLKDAAASSIYGSRAAFGVVLITTKKAGFNDKLSVHYDNNFAFSAPEELPVRSSIREIIRAARVLGETEGFTYSDYDLDIWEEELNKYEANPSLFPDGFSEVDGVNYSLREYDEFGDMMDKHGFRQQHNLSFTGGTDKVAYRLGLGYMNEDGILVADKDKYVKTNISAYITSKIFDWFTAEIDFMYNTSETTIPGQSSFGTFGLTIIHPSHAPIGYYDYNGESVPYQTSRNITDLDGINSLRNSNMRLFGKTTMNLFKGFTLISEWTYNKSINRNEDLDKVYITISPRVFQPTLSRTSSSLRLQNYFLDYYAINAYASYEYGISGLNMKFLAGYNMESSNSSQLWAVGTNLMNQDLPSLSTAIDDPMQGDSYAEFATYGFFFRANFSYLDRYLLEINGRYDGSSKFPEGHRFGFFPSVSAGWRISEEPFMESIKSVISNLKFRVSYGSIGNQAIPNYSYIPSMDAYDTHWIVSGADMKSIRPPALVSSSFTWEKVQTANIGLDLSLFHNKFNLAFDTYQRATIGMLTQGMELPATIGAPAPQQNVADLMAAGWELQVEWRDNIGNNFRYNIGFNLYDSESKITKFDNEVGLLSNYRVGQVLGEIWGYTTDRFFTEDDFDTDGRVKEGIPSLPGAANIPGDIVYKDYNGDGIINNGDNTEANPGDLVILGNKNRRYQYGITAGLGWKSFDLSLFLTGVGKRDLWRSGTMIFPFSYEWGTIFADLENYWTPDNRDAFYPVLRYSKNYNSQVQSKYLQDGSYIKLRNISLSYRVPKKILSKARISDLSVFVSGENLWTKNLMNNGLDPEMKDVQLGWNYPFMKKISFGMNVTF